jgi:hypothetical protein
MRRTFWRVPTCKDARGGPRVRPWGGHLDERCIASSFSQGKR